MIKETILNLHKSAKIEIKIIKTLEGKKWIHMDEKFGN